MVFETVCLHVCHLSPLLDSSLKLETMTCLLLYLSVQQYAVCRKHQPGLAELMNEGIN